MKKKLRNVSSQVTQQFDQQISEFKDYYDGIPPDERTLVRTWLEDLVDVISKCPPSFQGHIKANIDNSQFDENGEPIYIGGASLRPKNMLDAVRAWDDGDEFTPNAHGICS